MNGSNDMKTIFYTLLTSIFFTALLYGDDRGKIVGQVTDAGTKKPLVGVNVVVEGTSFGAATDAEGYYSIEGLVHDTYRLEFLYIGYKTIKRTDIVVSNNKPAIVNVQMSEDVFEGEQISVTAGYFVEEMMPQPSVTGLSREEIRRFPGGFEDVARTVATLPGVALNTSGGRNDLLVRGGGPSENLYIINNIEVPNINHFGTQGTGSGSLSFINLDFVDNVTFSTGGFSARYGDKMSSVLKLDMANGRTDKFGSKLLVSATQYGLNFEGPLFSNGSYIFSARQSYLDLIFKAADLPFVPIYTDFNVLVNYDISNRDKLFFIGLGAIDRVERDQSSEENRVTNAGIMDNTQNQWITGLNYRRLLDAGYLDLTANMNYNQYRFSQADENEDEYFNSKSDEVEYILKAQHYFAVNENIGLRNGISAKLINNMNNTVFADTIYDRSGNRIPVQAIGLNTENKIDQLFRKYAFFTEIDWILSKKLTVNGGLRLDYYSYLNDPYYLAPRLQIKYQLFEKLALKASSGLYYQSPSYVWLVNKNNRDLKALRNFMNIFGVDYLIRDDLRMAVETFYKKYTNLPTGKISDVNDYLVITNSGTSFGGREDDFQSFGYFDLFSNAEGKSYGFEWSLQKKYSDTPFYGQISLTYGKSEYTAGNGKTYPGQFDQRFILNLNGGYKFNDSWEISSKYRIFSGAPYTPVYVPEQNPLNTGQIQNLPDEYLAERLPTQSIWDLRVDRYFSFESWRLVAFIDIQNVLNTKIKTRPRYDFWNNEISNADGIALLPSIGISAEF
jgi:hypothetical protein